MWNWVSSCMTCNEIWVLLSNCLWNWVLSWVTYHEIWGLLSNCLGKLSIIGRFGGKFEHYWAITCEIEYYHGWLVMKFEYYWAIAYEIEDYWGIWWEIWTLLSNSLWKLSIITKCISMYCAKYACIAKSMSVLRKAYMHIAKSMGVLRKVWVYCKKYINADNRVLFSDLRNIGWFVVKF